ncbi:tRNA 2-selenouridine(34) synthase MnmH [Virgibacillus siamensis]|uniref:tRNA 2-selenouridine(34) synthase MnmH n=1 Tax=Virgibacillus siamensis TaxID=480071 RepID=UPI000985F773|nr:tRNA 2-selenouridine(34) synthase MnmH [Virgibacillus siamensis]
MFKDITLDELLNKQQKESHTIIDVRSPGEYHDATIPGSINIPVFSDEERTEVGTLYKQVSQEAAKKRGLEIFSAKLPQFIEQFNQMDSPKTVFCWRGGMRSKTAATVLYLMGIHVYRLDGGYRSYRQWVVETLKNLEFKPELYVLNGNTGSGKTILLNELSRKGYPVIDLEEMAGHRGSIFGQIGLKPNNQKKFESLLVQKLLRFRDAPFVFIEGESKRIGKVTIPEILYHKKEQGMQLFIDLPMDERVRNILDDYQPWNSPDEFLDAFYRIKKRIHTPVAAEIEEGLQQGNYHNAVKLLLEYYYDPRYEHSARRYPENQTIHLHALDNDHALRSIERTIVKVANHN